MKHCVGVTATRLNEEAITFSSGGNRLVGILTRPAAAAPSRTGVLLLSPGLKHRVGPHRLQVKLARLFAGVGLPVFRFDFHGTGDAGGELPSVEIPDLHDRIQNGYFREDTLSALDLFCERAGLERVIACGLCGGAITAVHAAEADTRIDGIIGFQLPVKVVNRDAAFADRISGEYSDFILTLYLKKLFRPSAWRNFLRGSSEYSLIWKTLTRRISRLLGLGRKAADTMRIPDGMNRTFLGAYEKIAGRVNMQWIYSEQERARYDFEGDFEQVCLRGRERPYEKVVIVDSNHEFAPDLAQERLFAVIADWLDRRYGAALRKAG